MKLKTQNPRTAVTIKQVAAAADVAVGTVSRVINGHEDVDARLRIRVEHAIRALGYRPNILAQNFVRNQSPILSFILSNSGILNPVQALILMGIEEYCEQTGYFVLFTRLQYDPQVKSDAIRLPNVLESNGLTDGIIVAGQIHDNLLGSLNNLGLPYVVLGNHTVCENQREVINQVRYDDNSGFYDATKYLIQLGHKDIWFVGDNSPPWFRTRYEGYVRAMAEHSLEARAQALALSDNAFDNGRANVELLIEEAKKMTAVVATSDDLAFGAIEALTQHGREVPRDVSVIGFDHQVERNRATHLTSVCVDTIQVGRELARSAIARIRGHGAGVPVTVVPTVLMKRGTCRPLRTESLDRMVL
jgi:DNA-binding LacI/PurR family transcriptional regulator